MKGGPESSGNQQRHINLKSSSSSRLEESSKHRQLAAVTDVTIEDYVRSGVPRYIAEMKHPLENTWTFWYQVLLRHLYQRCMMVLKVDQQTRGWLVSYVSDLSSKYSSSNTNFYVTWPRHALLLYLV